MNKGNLYNLWKEEKQKMSHKEYIAGSLDVINYVRMVTKYNGKFVLPYHKKS
jgi:hypothetical protein